MIHVEEFVDPTLKKGMGVDGRMNHEGHDPIVLRWADNV
jgi:hypothetical protein